MALSSASFSCTRTIPEPLYTVAARIEDADHGSDWLDSCRESRFVPAGRRPNRVDFEAYERLQGRAEWGIEDRDVYLSGHWQHQDGGLQCTLRPSAHPGPQVANVVRMPNLQGCFSLRPLSAHETSVTYALTVDLGGFIPKIVTKRAVKEIPAKSLAGLEQQARRGPGDYAQAGRELQAALYEQAAPEG